MSDEYTPTEETREHSPDESSDGIVDRRTFLGSLTAAGALGAVGTSGIAADVAAAQEDGWSRKPVQLETPWTDEVGPDNAHPEYPRPQMVREQWKNLNGVWGFAGAGPDEEPPIGRELAEDILVPYPVESGLSGIKRHETWMWYRRQFDVPDDWVVPTATEDDGDENNPNAQRLLMHFERVDWEATVYVNGEEVTTHQGGYDHFVADVTDALVEGGPQEVVVGVFDPTGHNTEPIGYQPKGRQGVGTGYKGENTLEMTPTSGIWDTVWIEPVPETGHVEGLDMTPDLETETLCLTAESNADDATVVASAYDGDDLVGRVVGSPNEELQLPVPDPHLWSPDDPFLYDLRVELRDPRGNGNAAAAGGGKLLDRVESYFGMRSIGKKRVDGVSRPTLNGEMIWHAGTLESGQWPDGLYTAPTDEALRANLQFQKELGYNMTRKHVKVETRRWFYHADDLGLLVWQDIPNMHEGFDSPPQDEDVLDHFEEEIEEMVTEHDNHPSMAVWIPINEGWGINNQNLDYIRYLVEYIEGLDPERLVDANSGYNIGSNSDSGAGDLKDYHWYGSPSAVAPDPDPDRISSLGEYTTVSTVIEDHKWGECGSEASVEDFLEDYIDSVERLKDLMVGRGLSASVYTATTGLENVCNGIVTYDRKVIKPALVENGLERFRAANESLREKARLVMGNVSIDVDAPPSYVSGDILGDTESFELSVTVANPESSDAQAETIDSVSVDVADTLPEGWTVSGPSGTSFGPIEDGDSTTLSWEVTPDHTADGDVTLDVTVEYEIGGNTYTYDDSQTVSAAVLGHWRFEDSPQDDSSYGNTLALVGDASYDDAASVEADYSLALDGDGDAAQISGQGTGNLHDAFSERSVSMWVKPDTTSGDQILYNEGGTINGFGVRLQDGTLEAVIAEGGFLTTISAPFTSTDWTHVATVFDNGRFALYVDGEEVAAEADVGYATVPSHVAGSEIGGNTTTSPWGEDDEYVAFFDGNVDDTAVFDHALTGEEIRTIGRRSFAVDAPEIYTAGPDPSPMTVEATFSDLREDGRTYEDLAVSVAELPDGWDATAQTQTEFDAVPDGEYVTTTWEVTPASGTDGAVELEFAAEYTVDGESRRLVDGTTLETLITSAEGAWQFNGTTEDLSGNGHDATLINGASFDDQDVIEGSHSVALDGEDDFIDLAEPNGWLSNAFSNWSVATWIKPDDTTGSQVIYNQGAAFNGLVFRINDGVLEVATINGGDVQTVSTPFTSTDWTHVAVVFEEGALRLYVDGELAASDEDVGYESVSGAYWGGELGDAETSLWSGAFDGNVDLSAVFAYSLTDEQVASLASGY